jgi:MFS family permease
VTTAPAQPPAADPPRRRGRRDALGLGRNVLALSVVSLLTDVSSEMIYPLLPLFLGTVLGAGAGFIGVIEGAAESTSAVLKLVSGWWSDRVRRRKPIVVLGYAIASAARPLVAVAQSASQVLAIRLTDRVGKGIRSSPRDALIADSVHPSIRGRAFGFHRAADHLGAVLGPLVAFALLQWQGVSLRGVFLWAAVPAVLAVLVLVVAVREVPRAPSRAASAPSAGAPPQQHDTSPRFSRPRPNTAPGADVAHKDLPAAAHHPAPLGRAFWAFLAVLLLFTLGNSTDAFLLLRASQLGVSTALIPVLWALLHFVKAAASTPGGTLSDRIGRRPLIVAGWALYAGVYFAFGQATATWQAWMLFVLYGLYFGLTEGAEKALIADLVPATRRGAAFGWYNLAISAGALPASVGFGLLWDRMSPRAAFTAGGALALLAAIGLVFVVPRRPAPA